MQFTELLVDRYRSLILKLMDWLIINIYGHLLQCDDFQFGFQELSSTTLCSWVVYETIDEYIRKGSKIYGALMDCTKAFDTVKHSLLFQKLLDAKIPPIIVRVLVHMYRKQTADVRWKSKFSYEFNIRNGVRQGAVLSPLLFCFYMNNLKLDAILVITMLVYLDTLMTYCSSVHLGMVFRKCSILQKNMPVTTR